MDENDALDFDLLITPDSGGYRVRLLSSPAGTASSTFSLPFSDLEIENLVLRMGQARTGVRRRESPQTEAAREFGQRLFTALLGGDLDACWRGSADEAAQQGKRLRLRLRLGDAPELLNLPWEYLYDRSADRFVTLSSNTPLVRYLDLPGQVEPLPVAGPLRILALIASPQDVAALDVEAEWRNLQAALADLISAGQVQIERCPQPTLLSLQRTLRRQEFHIFHFVGHGGYDTRTEDGVLLLEDDQRRSRPVSGRQLGALLHDEGQLRLAVLNACEGARTSAADPFAGVGQSLLRQGVPAVIAMQFAITDVAASTFAHEFYAAVADGYAVDRSLAEARKAMYAAADSVEWGTPVLYMRAVAGNIFLLPARQQRPPPPARQSLPIQPPPPPTTPAISPAASPATTLTPAGPAPAGPAPAGPAPAGAGRSRLAWGAGLLIALGILAAAFLFLRQPASTLPAGTSAAGTSAAATNAGASAAINTAPSAAPLPAQEPTFRYTFDDGEAAGWSGDPAEWAVVEDETGNYIYQGTAPPERETASELPGKEAMSTWRNYAVHLRVRAHQEGANPDFAEFWLTTRAPLAGASGCSFYNSFLNFRTEVVQLAKGGSDGSCEHIPIKEGSYGLLAGSQWYDLVVTVQDNRIQVAVDGDLVIDAEDDDVQQGYAFLNIGHGAVVQFDDVAVYRLDE